MKVAYNVVLLVIFFNNT